MLLIDGLMLASLICIWLLLLLNVVLIVSGYSYYFQCEKRKMPELREYPLVSILVPAHNEERVIGRTVESLLRLDYPHDRLEIIVVNDHSSDNSAEVLNAIQSRFPERMLHLIHTDAQTGGRGKANALNIALERSSGEYIVVYDADNTPHPAALKYLVAEITSDDKLGAVIGKFRTRNRNVNLLTRFINIETIAFQWMAQAGRWKMFKLCTIPGTNYIIRASILEAIGGWDLKAVAEDTEISFRVYMMGYRIKFIPQAVTWEQEPQTLRVWFRQRSRWVRGNLYVLVKNLPLLINKKARRIWFDILYYLGIYILLLFALTVSDFVLIAGAMGLVHTTLADFSSLLWLMAITLFVLGTYIAVTTEKGELNISNFFVIFLMYFTYSKMWMIVALYGIFRYLMDVIFKKETRWYKTERFEEKKG